MPAGHLVVIHRRNSRCRLHFFRRIAVFQLGQTLFQQRQLLAGAQQNLGLHVKLFAADQIKANQLRLQRLADFLLNVITKFTNAFWHGFMNLTRNLFNFLRVNHCRFLVTVVIIARVPSHQAL